MNIFYALIIMAVIWAVMSAMTTDKQKHWRNK